MAEKYICTLPADIKVCSCEYRKNDGGCASKYTRCGFREPEKAKAEFVKKKKWYEEYTIK